jgi:hypothetical protein
VRFRLSAAALALWAGAAGAQTRVIFSDVGPGASGPMLREALRRPHRLAEPDSGQLVITREVQVRGALIVLGRNTLIEGSVDGDVIVVNGDLFVRAGARIGGRAISIGGGSYPSALAVITGGSANFRDNVFDITRIPGGYSLAYRSTEPPPEPPLLFPGVYGFRLPRYDRVNGMSIVFGPAFGLGSDGRRADVLATWRTNLGVVDPSLRASSQFTRRTRAAFVAGRGSFSNDDWIRLDWVNSLTTLTFGDDTRNYFRADRGELTLHRLWETEHSRWEPFVGASWERAWSAGSAAPLGGPWSLLGRKDSLAMLRGNPAIAPGSMASGLVGTTYHWEADDIRLDARTRIEIVAVAPADVRFQQVTTDFTIGFPTFGEQSYGADVHWVTTLGDTPPTQRFVYLGGPGTLPFLDMLSQGGDELLLIDQRYSVPLTGVRLGDFGNPSLQFRHRLAATGLGSLPQFETMLGFGVAVVFVRAEVYVDPATGKAKLTGGFTFSR